jgi:hypothetical protein
MGVCDSSNGALLVTQNSGTMRIVRPDNGSVSAPLAECRRSSQRRRKDCTTSCSIPTSPRTASSTSRISLRRAVNRRQLAHHAFL